jgi:hypothetical protein
MKNIMKKVGLLVLMASLIFGLSIINVKAQPSQTNNKDEFEQMRVIMLVDMLNLDEKTSEKFISKFKSGDKVIKETMEELSIATLELELVLRKKLPDAEVAKVNDKIIQLHDKLIAARSQKMKDIRSVLNETQYAKLILFEKHQKQRMMKNAMTNRMKMMKQKCNAGGGKAMNEDKPESPLMDDETPDIDD